MEKPLNPESKDFLLRSNEALQKELKLKIQEIARQKQLIGYYENKLQINQPVNEVKVPIHERFPACFKPLNESLLSY